MKMTTTTYIKQMKINKVKRGSIWLLFTLSCDAFLFFSVRPPDSRLVRGIYNFTKNRMRDKNSEGKNVFAKECNVLM